MRPLANYTTVHLVSLVLLVFLYVSVCSSEHAIWSSGQGNLELHVQVHMQVYFPTTVGHLICIYHTSLHIQYNIKHTPIQIKHNLIVLFSNWI